jgi:pimeloyl-ACP methyl ester carboxylesterase
MTDADVLVLAHGAFHGPWCWQPTMQVLESKGLRCVAVDLNRGGLQADRDALQATVNALRREEGCRVHAIGHSLGCASVQALDARQCDAASGLCWRIRGHAS